MKIGIVVTGHGTFASGISGSIKVIAGEQKDYYIVDFDGLDTEKLHNELKDAYEKMKDYDAVFTFCDITGGSPFKFACELSQEYKNVRVIGGANVPLVVETALTRDFADDPETLINGALESAKNATQMF